MDECISKPIATCKAYRRQVYRQMSFWKRDSAREATNRASWSLVFGHASGDQCSSHFWWMTSESSILERNMRYTSSAPLRKTIL